MLAVAGLTKRFGELVAVDGVSFELAQGKTLGLLGPNGAGKTTTVSMIVGQVTPDAGQVLIDGQPLVGDTHPAKRRIGLVPQELALFEELSALENLRFCGALYDLDGAELLKAIDGALELVGLRDRGKDRVKTYSGGMKRRLNLAAALLHDPEILLLDEPTVGVDPQSRNAIFDNLEALKARGKALVYTTHYMEEAERLCDQVVIVDHGKVIADDTVRGLYKRLPAANRLRLELEQAGDVAGLSSLPGVLDVELADLVLRVHVDDLPARTPAVLGWLGEHGLKWSHVVSERADLEAVFLALTGRSLRDA